MKKFAPLCFLIAAAIIFLPYFACASPAPSRSAQPSAATARNASVSDQKKDWDLLADKLRSDGIAPAFIDNVFSRLDTSPTLIPMGTKIKELYSNHFLPKPKKHAATPFETELGIPGPWFKGVVTAQNAQACKDFLLDHADAFALAEIESGIPQEIAVALLFVETRLGTYLGKDNAFLLLASMSVTRDPSMLKTYLDDLPGAYDHLEWIRGKMMLKADWAYNELKALLEYCHANAIDPLTINGSIYGAIGLCQFMPSNIAKRGMDGNKDGRIDLFNVSDAVASLSNYLRKSGWQTDSPLDKKVKVLRSYNAMDIYARTILALAETILRLE
ncbi:MAG: lytic murein transglycosylase [Mailhella sp.]|nr:lytic murein transglycosylase [Mailhella sp.]